VLQGIVVEAEVWGAITTVAVIACWVAGKIKSHRRLASVYAFVLQLIGAYAVSFVVDMLCLSVAGELQLSAVILPAFVWSSIAGAAIIVAGTASSSPILLASPYALVALVAGLAGFIHVENLVTSLSFLQSARWSSCFSGSSAMYRARVYARRLDCDRRSSPVLRGGSGHLPPLAAVRLYPAYRRGPYNLRLHRVLNAPSWPPLNPFLRGQAGCPRCAGPVRTA
jgi:hypothetical protein